MLTPPPSTSSDFSEPDRLIGELLQPGGCLSLKKLGMESCLSGIDAVPVEGYKIFRGSSSIPIPYPSEKVSMPWSVGGIGKDGRVQEGRSFHHGRFVQNLRKKAAGQEGVTLVEATVNELIRDGGTNGVIGVEVTPRGIGLREERSPIKFHAQITMIIDGCHSKFRKAVLPPSVYPTVRSNFVGLYVLLSLPLLPLPPSRPLTSFPTTSSILENPDLPAPHHGHVILHPPTSSPSPSPIGPILVYQLSPTQSRMLIDIPGPRVPSSSSGELSQFLSTHVTSILPSSLVPSFEAALDASNTNDRTKRLKVMPNQYLSTHPPGHGPEGAILVGDSLNMRHPLTGGGMTVAFNDAVLLVEELGGEKVVGEVDARKNEYGVCKLNEWEKVCERLEEWYWDRKPVATSVNVLSIALYSLFAAGDDNLLQLQKGCFRYLQRGGSSVSGPVSLLSVSVSLSSPPTPANLHNPPASTPHPGLSSANSSSSPSTPSGSFSPLLSFGMFWTACKVLLPVLWAES
ncbi:squalene monooxygenase, partial [Phenoliferia sp. Uapishka_3]